MKNPRRKSDPSSALAAAAARAEVADGPYEEELRHSSSSGYSSSRPARGRGHTHRLGKVKKTTDSRCTFLETYSQEVPTVAAAAHQLHY